MEHRALSGHRVIRATPRAGSRYHDHQTGNDKAAANDAVVIIFDVPVGCGAGLG